MVIETPKGLVHSVRITNKVFKAWSDGASEWRAWRSRCLNRAS